MIAAPPSRPSVAVLGTGLMGAPMAMTLLDAGFRVAVWNRTAEKMEPIVARGAKPALAASSAAADAQIVLTMLTDGPSLTDLLFSQGVADAVRPGALIIDSSSIAPATARKHAARLIDRGVHHLDAPVSGGPQAAVAGTLSIMVGGEADDFARARPVLNALGRATLVGGHGSGQLTKLVNQLICGAMIVAVAEGLLLAREAGCDPAIVSDALRGGYADSFVLQNHGRRMIDRDWRPGGKSATHLKDLRTAGELASSLELDLPLLRRTTTLYDELVAQGEGDLDHSAVMLLLERRNHRVLEEP
jgi:2-hydroxy-3-oxopropionate reductase